MQLKSVFAQLVKIFNWFDVVISTAGFQFELADSFSRSNWQRSNWQTTSAWFTHRDGRVIGTVCQHSRDIQYVSVHDLDFCSYNLYITRFSRSGVCKGEVDIPGWYVFRSLYAFLSRSLVTPPIATSSWIKLYMNHCVKYVTINRMCHSFAIFNIP